MQGIVFNPHYMAFVDVALTEYWRAVGMTYPAAFLAEGVDMFMVAARQAYRDAARFDDEIDVFLRGWRIWGRRVCGLRSRYAGMGACCSRGRRRM